MDVGLHLRVLWRFRVLMGVGLVLAILFAFLSAVRVVPGGHPTFRYRKAQQYVSYATLGVSQQGFPEGQLNPPASAAPEQFTSDAILYSTIATSDPVRKILRAGGPIRGTLEVAPLLDQSSKEPLPFISIAAFSDSPSRAINLAKRETAALIKYLQTQQSRNGIATDNRVRLNVTHAAGTAALFAGRSKTLSIVVFLTGMIAFAALAFILENMRPRIRSVKTVDRQRSATSDAA